MTCVILVIRTVLRTRTQIPDLMQTKNLLTVAGLLNVACPFQFGHGVTVVTRVGQVGSRKQFALRKESGMRRNRLQVFFSEVISAMASE